MKRMTALICLLVVFNGVCQASPKDAVVTVLNALHQHAAAANATEYFALFSEDAVFIGTDASETWTLSEFKQYAMPHFSKGNGWTYHPYDRHVYVSEDGNTAWFDELLRNSKLGVTRGTGVLVKQGQEWKVAQYHLAIPVPNAIASDIAGQIQAHNKKGDD